MTLYMYPHIYIMYIFKKKKRKEKRKGGREGRKEKNIFYKVSAERPSQVTQNASMYDFVDLGTRLSPLYALI